MSLAEADMAAEPGADTDGIEALADADTGALADAGRSFVGISSGLPRLRPLE